METLTQHQLEEAGFVPFESVEKLPLYLPIMFVNGKHRAVGVVAQEGRNVTFANADWHHLLEGSQWVVVEAVQ